ncbi:MAG: hypothetical protein IPF98_12815 [Gemmatimonadetes bacterium]|nr:hypothetical protein [Gemmatimonadota bacterium]
MSCRGRTNAGPLRWPRWLLLSATLSFPLSVAGVTVVAAQRPAGPVATMPTLTGTPELEAISRLKWRSIGPANQAGRVPVVVGIPGDRSTYYVGSAAGD